MLEMVEVKIKIVDTQTIERIRKFIDQKNKELNKRNIEEWETPWTIEDAVYVLMMRGLDDALKMEVK